ncbi:uncharacterized protein JCM6883_001086 [Sporobolomyces salmoneus]|uniref:uncharacterized protein n=1 Tax=Sporobolomyces salmoneus TaxID=183962 RepID=UPI003175D9E7
MSSGPRPLTPSTLSSQAVRHFNNACAHSPPPASSVARPASSSRHSHSHHYQQPPSYPPHPLSNSHAPSNGTSTSMHPGAGVPASIVASTPNSRGVPGGGGPGESVPGIAGGVAGQGQGQGQSGQPGGGPNPQSVGVMPSGGPPPPGMMAPPHPSAARLNDLLEFVKAEFEQVAGEGGMLRAQKDEYEAMIHSHAAELNAMRAMAYDLERKYHDDKRVLQEENSRLQDEVTRLRQQLDSTRNAVSTSSGGATIPPLASNAPPASSSSRPTLPSLMGGQGAGPQSPSVRPASTGPTSHSVGMFGGGAAAQIGEREREYAAQQGYHNGNGRDQSLPAGDHAGKRSRMEEDDRRKPSGQRHSSALPSYASSSVGPNRPASTGPHLPNSAPLPPPLHHPSPLPPSNGLPPLSTSAPSPAPPVSHNQSQGSSSTPGPTQPSSSSTAAAAATTKPDEKPNVEVTNFDPETAPKDLKKEGSDWMTMFNPNVKRVLDVGLVHTLVHDSVVCCVRFSPDGKVLATGCNRNTTLYDTKTGAKISVLSDESSGANNDNYIRSASFSPDGKYLATGSEDRIVRIWNLAQKRIAQVFQGHKSEIYSLAFSPDGRRLVSGSGDKTARMWDLETGACLFTLAIEDITIAENGPVDAGVTSVVLSPDGKFLAAGSLDTVVRIWDAENGQLVDKLKGHKDSVYSVAFSPDGKFLVSGSLDKTLKMWDMASLRMSLASQLGKDVPVGEGGKTNCLTTLQGHKDYVLSVDISPDGAWIVSGSKDRGVQFWDPKTAKAQFMLQGHKNSVISVAVSDAGGLVATGSGDWSARIWSYERIA